ncbi:uncharacterized protein LOC131603496 isoform X1 [Vicia villosa]|uniref:uncharacterized protein LOC131603496 isoform X1 n=1 Tax=Vicia villosa TaxID=3911 RepID=UPI00273B852D|nr:uncharacterized protein LOC131603496 isoform X1 [Vicia villosa]
MAFGFGSSDDVSGFKFLFLMALIYALISMLTYSVIHMKFINPLLIDAPLDRFSEARAIEHVRMLSQEIDGRHEGRPGLKKAALYIKGELELIKDRATSNVRIEIEESTVSGSFNMNFLRHHIALGYRNHTNILMRISSIDSKDTDPSVLVNAHFDGPLGSPGAGDCGSCVASMLEIARLIVDSGSALRRPVIFLFNGAEELFMLGSHGFMKTNKWHDTIGAFINVEASGTGGPDLVCQSGPSSWPSNIYAEAAMYPMATSAAQDVFPIIPGDTDYRIFSEDYGDIPGLDIIFLLGGYFYHTSYDTLEQFLPGSLQARGENLLRIIKAFTNSSKLQNKYQKNYTEVRASLFNEEQAVFFDYLSWFMIFYSKRVAKVLHSIPIFLFLVMSFTRGQSHSWFATLSDFVKGFLFHAAGIILAVVVPVAFSLLRLLFSSHTMNWFAHPFLAFMMFIPCGLVGLIIPRIIWRNFPLSQDAVIVKRSKEALADEARFWGAFGFYAVLTLAYLAAGLSGGFVTFFACASMLPSWISFCLSVKSFGRRSFRSTMFYILPLVPCLAYAVYFGGFLAQFLIEKMGMMGSLPQPYGYYVPDIIVAAVIGLVTGWSVGPLIPICSHWLARSSIVRFLLHLSVLALALSSQFFPYSMSAPKRIVFQHTFRTAGSSHITESTYDFSVLDSNSLQFLFKHSPEAAEILNVTSKFSFESASQSKRHDWMVLFPVSSLFSNSLKFPANEDAILKQYQFFPTLFVQNTSSNSEKGHRRVHLELYLGSLEEIWVTVLNITGPLSSWSFADNVIPGTEAYNGGPPSYILRLSGPSDRNWSFWLEANSSEALRVEVSVLDQKLVDPAKRLKSVFPKWVDVVAYSSFISSYTF